MTSLMIHLPDELAELFEDTGILKSPETIEMLKNLAIQAKQKQEFTMPHRQIKFGLLENIENKQEILNLLELDVSQDFFESELYPSEK